MLRHKKHCHISTSNIRTYNILIYLLFAIGSHWDILSHFFPNLICILSHDVFRETSHCGSSSLGIACEWLQWYKYVIIQVTLVIYDLICALILDDSLNIPWLGSVYSSLTVELLPSYFTRTYVLLWELTLIPTLFTH